MATELIGNNATAIVGVSGYTAGSGSLVVDSTAAPFPQFGNFSVNIIDQATGALKALLKVTSVTNSTTFVTTSVEGIDNNAVSGDIVQHVLSAGAMDRIRLDLRGYGARASLPATTRQKTANSYRPNNSPYNDYYFDGTLWQPRLGGMEIVEPDSSIFTWANQGTATETATQGGLKLLTPASASENVRIRYIAQPARPYTITVLVRPLAIQANFWNMGLCFYNSTSGKIHTHGPTNGSSGQLQFQVAKWNSVTSFAAAYLSSTGYTGNGDLWLRLLDDATNFVSSFSFNGIDWIQAHTVSRTDFITPDKVGYFVTTSNATWPAQNHLLHWKQT